MRIVQPGTWVQSIFNASPRWGMALLEAIWTARARFRLMPRGGAVATRKDLRRLFQGMKKADIRRVQRRGAVCHARSAWLMDEERHRGHARIQALVEVEAGGEAILQELIDRNAGVIVTTWHLGPTPGVWALLCRYPIRLLKVQNRTWHRVPENWEVMSGALDAAKGVALLRKTRKHLRSGGWVAMTFDHTYYGTRQHLIPILGRMVGFRSGLPAMAIASGAPIVLISTRWSDRGQRVIVRVHEPVYPDPGAPDGEAELLRGLVGEMERFVLAHPWEQPGVRVRRLLFFPRIERAGADPHQLPGDKWRRRWRHGGKKRKNRLSEDEE